MLRRVFVAGGRIRVVSGSKTGPRTFLDISELMTYRIVVRG